jgi:DisA bacterial checkpoint controller nucleotide-binding
MSGNTIKYFMWGFQRHFRVAHKSFASRVFKTLDQAFKPELFLVGILVDENQERFPACVEPEQDFWIHSERFNDVPSVAKTLVPSYPESGMFQSHPLAQKWQDEDLLKRSIRDAIYKIIQAELPISPDLDYYVSLPAKVEGYLVCTVLGLQRNLLDSNYALKQTTVRIHDHRNAMVAVSLIDAAAEDFLEHARQELLKPEPGLRRPRTTAEDIIRNAGRRLCEDTVVRIHQGLEAGGEDLFNACNTISSLEYEKSAAAGHMVLCQKNHPSLNPAISFPNPRRLSEYRAARKLFQLASGDLSLHSDSEQVLGLVTVREYNESREDLFEMRVLGNNHWELNHAGRTIMRVRYRLPYLPRLSFDESKLRHDLARIFKSITPTDIDRLVALIRTAEQASHGALLIIDENSAEEAKRLRKQGTPIDPCVLTPDVLRHLTTIDGAILLSPEGTCHGIGTILDGVATESGDPGRGARLNSALRYAESHWPCLAVVVSEDGGIDFIPNMPPALRRSDIDRAINEIKDLSAATPISRTRYNAALDFLDDHRFYLRQGDCDALNPLVDSIDDSLQKQDQIQFRIIRDKFVPNTQLVEELFYIQQEC